MDIDCHSYPAQFWVTPCLSQTVPCLDIPLNGGKGVEKLQETICGGGRRLPVWTVHFPARQTGEGKVTRQEVKAWAFPPPQRWRRVRTLSGKGGENHRQSCRRLTSSNNTCCFLLWFPFLPHKGDSRPSHLDISLPLLLFLCHRQRTLFLLSRICPDTRAHYSLQHSKRAASTAGQAKNTQPQVEVRL